MKCLAKLGSLIVLGWLVTTLSAQTPPQMPFNPWGRVTIDNQIINDGTTIQAYINGILVATMSGGSISGYYALSINPDDPGTSITDGGTEGDTVVVRVNGAAADTTLQWSSGDSTRADLNVSTTRTIVVSPSLPACQTGTSYFTSIAAAVANANNGDTITICPGTYSENTIEIDHEIRLNGTDPNTTIVNSAVGDRIFRVLADNVEISGLTLSGANNANNDSAIQVGETDAVSQYLTIRDNIISNNSYGIEITLNGDQVTITGNTITNNAVYGIFMGGSQNHQINNNDIVSNVAYGIVVGNAQNNTIQNNRIQYNTYGIWLFGSSNNQITANTIENNTNDGLSLRSSTSNQIQQNTITQNDPGIYLEQSSINNTISDNNITQNTTNLFNDQSSTIVAEDNWWGSTNCTTIDASIHDNEEGDGEVDFDPVLDAAYPSGSSTPCSSALPLVVSQTTPACTQGVAVYTDIASAVSAASTADTIVVCPGTYQESIVITLNDLTITAYDSDPNNTVVVACKTPPPGCHNFTHVFEIVGAQNVTISGFTITGTGPAPYGAITLTTATNCTIKNNIITLNDRGVMCNTQSAGNLIYNNKFTNNTVQAEDASVVGNFWDLGAPIPGTNIIGGSLLGGNYWDDYLGQDLNFDGIGDTLLPYTHNGNIQNGGDYLPLVTGQ